MTTFKTSPHLEGISLDIIIESYHHAKNKVLFLDYDGTLTPIVDDPSLALFPKNIKHHITDLSQSATVVIISGRDQRFLEETFKGLPVHLVAEHGAFIKMPFLSGWQKMSPFGQDWQHALKPILYGYQERCPGSVIEQKASSLAWHYRTVKNQAEAEKSAARLLVQLEQSPIVADMGLQTIAGKKVIEIKRGSYDKGTAASRYLHTDQYDFVLAMGDDTTDEHMFDALPDSSFTIKVGAGPTSARSRLSAQPDVELLLKKLSDNC